jgi:hypothetical protein
MYKFKIRCSAIGKIMSANGKITAGNATYLEEWLKEQLYQRRNTFSSKYCDKGNIIEDESIEMIGQQLGLVISKNEESKENDYFTGTCDVDTGNMIIDAKNSWSCFSFPLFDEEPKNKDYVYQLQGYMDLYGRDKAKLVYTLINTPEKALESEIWRYAKDNEITYDEAKEVIMPLHNYDNIPSYLRYKEFNIERDEELIEQIKKKVKVCQLYIDQLVKKLKIGEF